MLRTMVVIYIYIYNITTGMSVRNGANHWEIVIPFAGQLGWIFRVKAWAPWARFKVVVILQLPLFLFYWPKQMQDYPLVN